MPVVNTNSDYNFQSDEKRGFRQDYKTLAGFVSLFAIFIYFMDFVLHPKNWHFLDGVDLVIHEAGHVIFMPFGEFISFAGGTIAQILMPLIFVLYFARRRSLISASIISFWLAQSLANVSVYAADAQKMELPLLGGGIHDWNYLLGKTNLLMFTPQIALFIQALATLVCCIALAVGFYGFYDRNKAADKSF
jgi:hypothetical protein